MSILLAAATIISAGQTFTSTGRACGMVTVRSGELKGRRSASRHCSAGGGRHPSRRRHRARTERWMGGPTMPQHDAASVT